MPLELRWVGESELDRVAQTRLLCYAHHGDDAERYRKGIRENPTARAGDFLLAEEDGEAVGTATSLSMTMWLRGAAAPCQGVAWVGTIKTHRRRAQGRDGVATQIMRELAAKARERGQAVSALMPFRGSFYQHFGYGFVERRNRWTIPLATAPQGDFAGIRFYQPKDLADLVRFHQQQVEGGQCDIQRPPEVWEFQLKARCEAGFVVVDRSVDGGPIIGYLAFEHAQIDGKDILRVMQMNYQDISALRRQLHFLASLRDQYFSATLMLPIDVPLNWLLREAQLPHRLVNHAHAELAQETRMQVRVLDHRKLIEAMKLPSERAGAAVVQVDECEGVQSRFRVDISDGRAQVSSSSASPEFTCQDHVWAAIVCGDLSATKAVQMSLAACDAPAAAQTLDAFAVGPAPFCHEYF